MLEIRDDAGILTTPNQPIWYEDGSWWALAGRDSSSQTISALNPFDLVAALWRWLRWRLPAENQRAACRRIEHRGAEREQKFYTRFGVYRHRECGRCHDSLGWFRPSGERVPPTQTWCDEGHVLNCIGRWNGQGYVCVHCGAEMPG